MNNNNQQRLMQKQKDDKSTSTSSPKQQQQQLPPPPVRLGGNLLSASDPFPRTTATAFGSTSRCQSMPPSNDDHHDFLEQIKPSTPSFRSVRLANPISPMALFAQPTAAQSNKMSNNNEYDDEEPNFCTYQFQSAVMVQDNSRSLLERSPMLESKQRPVDFAERIDKKDPEITMSKDEGTRDMPGWNLKQVQVRMLPMYVELGRFSWEFPKSKLDIVLDALQDLFRALSLQVQYYSCPREQKDAAATTKPKTTASMISAFLNDDYFYTVMARCTSMEGVQFLVMIWETKNHQYAVEVSHNSGCKDAYYNRKYPFRVIEAVREALQEEKERATTTATPMQYYDPMANFRDPTLGTQIDNLLRHAKVHMEVDEAITIVEDLVQTKRFDTVKLGLDSLLVQTDPRCSGQSQALVAAQAVLSQSRPISNFVASLALEDRFPSGYLDTMPAVTKQLALTALTVLAQAVTLLADDTEHLQEFVHWRTYVVERLMARVQDADQAPHFAYLAAHILAVIIRAVPEARHDIRRHTVEHAKFVGSSCHGALAQASNRLLKEMRVLSCYD